MGKGRKKHRPFTPRPAAIAHIDRSDSGDSDRLIEISNGAIKVAMGDRKRILIDSSKLAAPRNVYDADVSWVEHRTGNAVSIFFAKLHRDKRDQLKSRVEVRYPPEDFVRHFWGNSRAFHKQLAEVLAPLPRDDWRDAVTPEKWPSEKEHSEWVNFDYLAYAGGQAALDFFNLEPGGVARYTRGQGSEGLELHAVVRVHTTTHELRRLLDQASPIVDMIKTYMPGVSDGDHEEKAGREE